MIYRVKQFYWAITSSFKKPDYQFLSKYLNNEEILLFKKLSISEQFHCIRVANKCLTSANINKNICENDISKLMKICLLHDIGKIDYRINIIEKSFLVILGKFSKGKMKKISSTNNKVKAYYYHAEHGADILKSKGYDEDIVEVIRNHHKDKKSQNIFLELLKNSDNIS